MSLNKADIEGNARRYRAYAAAKPINATPSRTHCAASVLEPLVLPKWEVRRGADDHQNIQSRGF